MAIEWPETSIAEECDLLTGFPFKSARYTNNTDGVRLLRGDNIVQGQLRWDGVKRWPADATTDFQQYELREHDVVIAMDRPWIEAGLKYASISTHDLPALLVQRVSRLRGGPRLETRFLKYIIQSAEFTNHVLAVQTGTAVPHISSSQINAYRFRRPPWSVQRLIVDILGTLDDKIELNRRVNETMEAMARRLFKSWFVDFDPVHAKAALRRKHPKLSNADLSRRALPTLALEIAELFPDSFGDSTLGPIPHGWKVDSIKNVASNVQYGFTQSSSANEIGPRFLRITDIQGGRVDWHNVPYCKTLPEEFFKYRVLDGDIFVARTGASTGENVYIVDPPSAVFASYLVRIQFVSRGIGRVVAAFMRSDEYFGYVAGTIGGSAQPNASAPALTSVTLAVPQNRWPWPSTNYLALRTFYGPHIPAKLHG